LERVEVIRTDERDKNSRLRSGGACAGPEEKQDEAPGAELSNALYSPIV
jgi:hypothetical protein